MGQNGAGGHVPSVVSAAAPASLVWKDSRLQGPGGLGLHLHWGSILSEVRFQGDWGEDATLPSGGPMCVIHKLT